MAVIHSPIVFVSKRELVPVTVDLFARIEELIPEWSIVMAGVFFAIIPELVLAYALQKYAVGGLTAGAVKHQPLSESE